MPAAKNAPDAAAPADPAPATAPADVAATPASISTVAAPPASAPAVSGLSRLLARAADAAIYGGAADKGPALSALSARMDEVVMSLPAALAVADGDLKDALSALSALLN